MNISRTTSSPQETFLLGQSFAKLLRGGDVVLLNGELGAGKTVFVKGVAVGLGIVDDVTSPTFVIVQTYENVSDLSLHHVDLYRTTSADEVDALAIDELLDERSVALVEWGSQCSSHLTKGALVVEISPAQHDGEDVRHFTFTCTHDALSWENRLGELGES